MKIYRLIYFLALSLLVSCTSSEHIRVGKSIGRWDGFGVESMKQYNASGVEYLEVTINPLIKHDRSKAYERARKLSEEIREAEMHVWSVHLPFSRSLDISVLDDSLRRANIDFIKEMIRLAGMFHPKYLVLHPSSEPIADEDRTKRLLNSHVSIGELATVAKEIDAFICVENLPRTCLGQTGEEMMQLIDGYDDVFLCFDTNHLFYQSHSDYLRAIPKGKIKTLHLSDYDFVNESHLPPGQGKINWQELLKGIKENGYCGVMMFECDASPEEMLDCLSLR